jgi:hypothetical protein
VDKIDNALALDAEDTAGEGIPRRANGVAAIIASMGPTELLLGAGSLALFSSSSSLLVV